VLNRYRQFFEAGFKVYSFEFGANPLTHYPVPGIERDLPYVFLASSNQDKWIRYFNFLPAILRKYPGFVDGPGWNFANRWNSVNGVERDFSEHRYLYARAKVGLNLHIIDSIAWPSELNERTYALAACGTPQLVDRALLIDRYFSKDAFFVGETPKDYFELFQRMQADPKECQRRALIAQKEVFERHTTFQRCEGFIRELVGGLRL
jgi:spore maturation protein CgeB